ncbi:MAG: ribosomal RNA small subunit methyltransferase A [Erysipelotrichaceae bacterium]|nr:ribosomal RNA small subunit methyltransferase A [Erysipelotrichaceae bacterium]MBR2825967.1 ribosomal RNA small subunit methyltransferase A [Erysipelotrichaceae bacterium]MBR6958604.1 ribosomal RNA small subunit methyltransferase A [Erysipelotrichaceae bacterium]
METIANITTVRKLLDEYDLKAKKKYGQNFLVDEETVKKIVDEVDDDSFVLEIGPGLGALTQKLVKAHRVIAYEIDSDLVRVLNEIFKEDENLDVRNQDITEVDLGEVIRQESDGRKCTVVSNLPYYITTDILNQVFCSSDDVEKVIVMMQKEVAMRFVNRTDRKDYNVINVLADLYSDYEPVCRVGKHCFYPVPGVDSAVLKFELKNDRVDMALVEFIRDCFSNRRKLLLSVLKQKGYGVDAETFGNIGLSDRVRVEDLSVSDFVRLYEVTR